MDSRTKDLHSISIRNMNEGRVMNIGGYMLIATGIALDVFSGYLGVRNLIVRGPSGVPVVGWCVFAIGCWSLQQTGTLPSDRAWLYAKVYIPVHIFLNFGVVLIAAGVRKLRRRTTSERRSRNGA